MQSKTGMKEWLSFVTMAFLATMAGCESTESENVKTPGFYAEFSVKALEGNRVECFARFQVGGPEGTYLALNAGDEVTCEGRSMEKKVDILGQVFYATDLSSAAGEEVQLHFYRPNEPKYETVLSVPEDFAPRLENNPNGVISKSSPLHVSWSPPSLASVMTVTASFKNPQRPEFYGSLRGEDRAPEQGHLYLGVPANVDTQGSVGENWQGHLEFRRYNSYTMPSGLKGRAFSIRTKSLNVELID